MTLLKSADADVNRTLKRFFDGHLPRPVPITKPDMGLRPPPGADPHWASMYDGARAVAESSVAKLLCDRNDGRLFAGLLTQPRFAHLCRCCVNLDLLFRCVAGSISFWDGHETLGRAVVPVVFDVLRTGRPDLTDSAFASGLKLVYVSGTADDCCQDPALQSCETWRQNDHLELLS